MLKGQICLWLKIEGARVTRVLVFGSIYQGGHVGTGFLSHSHKGNPVLFLPKGNQSDFRREPRFLRHVECPPKLPTPGGSGWAYTGFHCKVLFCLSVVDIEIVFAVGCRFRRPDSRPLKAATSCITCPPLLLRALRSW